MPGVHQVGKSIEPQMMLLCGQTNAIWSYWAGLRQADPKKYQTGVGFLICPSYIARVQPKKFMPFVLDNDAFNAWKKGIQWDEKAWRDMIGFVRMTTLKPLWAAVPDVVADREATLANWPKYSPAIKAIGWKAAFCVQDGMSESDIPSDADVLFIGGTDGWKMRNLPRWTAIHPRVHAARINAIQDIEACERLGCESVDGTGWFRDPSRDDKLPAIERFIEGHRNETPFAL